MDQNTVREKRESIRAKVGIPVNISYTEPDTELVRNIEAQTINISERGVCLRLHSIASIPLTPVFTLTLPFDNYTIKSQGQLVWVNKTGQYNSFQTGWSFAHIQNDYISPLRDFISNLAPSVFDSTYTYQNIYDFQKTIKEISRGMVNITNPDKLIDVILRLINKKIQVAHISIIICDHENNLYSMKGRRGKLNYNEMTMTRDNPLIRWFSEFRNTAIKQRILKRKDVEIITTDKIGQWLSLEQNLGHDRWIKDVLIKIKSTLKELDTAVCIPSFYKDKLIGMLLLSEKYYGIPYTEQDIYMLSTLANDAAIALRNAQLFDILSQEKMKTDIVFKEMSDGIVLLDSQSKVILFNKSAGIMLNLKENDSSGCTIFKLFKDFEFSIPWQKLATGCEKNSICEMRKKDGSRNFLSNRITKIENDKGCIIGYIMILRDTTEEKKESLIKKNFFSLISHKLRTPLTAICGYSSLLCHRNLTENQIQDALYHLNAQAEILSKLIEELLDSTLIETERLQLRRESIHLDIIMELTLGIVKSKFELTDTSIIIDESVSQIPRVFIDIEKIQEVLKHLLENAIKFNNNPEKVIRISALRTDNNFIQVQIQDNSSSIQSRDYDKIFTEFYQIDDDYTGQVKGAGVGLAIVKRIITIHGGKIWVESAPEGGNTFNITLPVAQEKDLEFDF